MDLNVLPLGGCDLVLGTQWLRTLRVIHWDFNLLTMTFQWHGKSMIVKGLRPSRSSLQDVDLFFKKPARKGLSLQITAQLFTIEPSLPMPELESLLEEFAVVFKVPQGLPPSWAHEHNITLKEGIQPVCGRPYRYLYF